MPQPANKTTAFVRFVAVLTLTVIQQLSAAGDNGPALTCSIVACDAGRESALLNQGAAALKALGAKVQLGLEPATPQVVLATPCGMADEAVLNEIQHLIDQGSGLVLVYGRNELPEPHVSIILSRWRVTAARIRSNQEEIAVHPHPITDGVGDAFLWPVPVDLRGLRELARQGEHIIAGYSTRGGRRLVVLPIDAVVPGQPTDAIPSSCTRLLAQAVFWAARAKLPTEPQPSASSGAASTGSAAGPVGRAFIDIAAEDEDWPQIRQCVERILKAAGFRIARETEESSDKASSALLNSIRADIPLIVLGSCRQYTDLEVAALELYVRSGGALLVLPRATNRSNDRIVAVNAVLSEFGLAAALGRPAGDAVIDDSGICGGIGQIGRIAAGVLIVGPKMHKVISVGGRAAVAVARHGAGRVAVFDALPLLSKYAGAAAQRWQKALMGVLRWLSRAHPTGAAAAQQSRPEGMPGER